MAGPPGRRPTRGDPPRLVVLTTVADNAWMLLRGQLHHLATHGFDVVFISSPGPLLNAVARREGVPVVPVPMQRDIHLRADIVSLVRLVMALRRIRPDVVVAGTPKAGLLGGVAAWLARVPLRVYLLRGLRLETVHGPRRILLWLAERVSVRCAHATVVVSASLRERARELGLLRRSRAFVLGRGAGNGVDMDRFGSFDRNATRAGLGLPADAFVFGFVGRVHHDKGITELVEAFDRHGADHPDAWLVMAGGMEARGVGDSTLHTIEDHPRISYAGWLPDPAPVFGAIDVLVLPTHREGFPNVVLEAGAAGKPAITTYATGAVDSVEDGRTGILVRPGDVAQLAAAMRTLHADPELAREMGRRSRAVVAQNFTNATVWHNLTEFLWRELASRRDTGAVIRDPDTVQE